MNKVLLNPHCFSYVAILLVTLYPSLTVAQSGRTTEDLTATSTTIYATTSAGESLPVPINSEGVTESAKVPTREKTSASERPLSASQQDRIINLAANISNRLDTALARLQNIHTRMESRANLLTSSGQDTTNASMTLAQSNMLLSQIKTQLEAIDAKVYAATTSPTPRTAWITMRNDYISIAMNLRTNKELLIRVLTQLKTTTPISPSQEQATSTTPDPLTP